MIGHVLKVDCKNGILQVLDLIYSDFDVLCFELIIRFCRIAAFVIDYFWRIDFDLSFVGLCTFLSLGLLLE